MTASPAAEKPAVTAAEAIDDAAWFDARPSRRFRARIGVGGLAWIIRRLGAVFLRVVATAPLPAADTDAALSPAWFEGAYPGLLAAKARAGARRAGGRR